MTHAHEGGVRCDQCELRASGFQAVEGQLDPLEQRCLENIEKYHCQIWHVHPDGANPDLPPDDGFSYSVGIYASLGAPELIIFGQKPEWRAAMINAIVADISNGRQYEAGKTYGGLIDGFDASFHEVPFMAYPAYLGWDIWYYERFHPAADVFPTLQVVWPDLRGRYPWEAAYENSYKQPILESYHWSLDGERVKASPLR